MIDKTLLKHGETIAVALSGGKDSICLLSLLLKAQKEFNLTVKAVHVNHNIRASESEHDADFCKNYCEKLGVPIKIFSVNAIEFSKTNNYSLEQGARILRYEIFAGLIKDGYCNKIATAHHSNDNFETLLFNIFRGTGLKGAKGIPAVNGYIIRPILLATRTQIDDYVKINNLPFVLDSTNFDTDITRNYIRNEITPKILDKFPDAITSSNRFCAITREEDEFLDELAIKALTESDGKIYLSLNNHPVIIKRATIIALAKLSFTKDYEYIHAKQVENLKNLQSGAKITLPKGIVAQREYDNIVFYVDCGNNGDTCYKFCVGTFNFNGVTVKISKESGDLRFDGDKIPQNAVIRNRLPGDVFTKFGGGTKKLKEFLIDKKIPLTERNNLKVIADGKNVLVIIGLEISDTVKITKESKNILYASKKAEI